AFGSEPLAPATHSLSLTETIQSPGRPGATLHLLRGTVPVEVTARRLEPQSYPIAPPEKLFGRVFATDESTYTLQFLRDEPDRPRPSRLGDPLLRIRPCDHRYRLRVRRHPPALIASRDAPCHRRRPVESATPECGSPWPCSCPSPRPTPTPRRPSPPPTLIRR